MLQLTDPVDKIPLIGSKYKKLLGKLDIETVEDLLYHFPVRHADTSEISQISQLNTFEKKTIQATVESIKNIRTKFRKFITEATVYDESGSIDVIWFNQPFLTNSISSGSKILLNGKLNPKRNIPQLYSPSYEILKRGTLTHLGIIVPQYSVTEGVTDKWLRSRIHFVLTKYPNLLEKLKNIIPQTILEGYDLENLDKAIKHIHFPPDKDSLQQAKKRLAFDELLDIQLKLVRKIQQRKKLFAPKIRQFNKVINKFLENLEFKPTNAQLRAIKEITSDFDKTYPANRLLQGDVGCGKTLVAAAVSIPVVKSGFQVALMAPTAILAKQHYQTLNELLKSTKFKIKLVTGTTKPRVLRSFSEEGSSHPAIQPSNIIIGTHALLHRYKELFNNLGLVIIDEQHRFGVKQRKVLTDLSKDSNNEITPHKITMTATPIPRSIALTLFGDLDISIIDEMPPGRKPTRTHLIPPKKRTDSYTWIKGKVKDNKSQVFWICPLIEESEKLQTKAVITEYEKLETEIFPKLRIGLLHGRLSEQEKNDKISNMRQGKIDILVSTSVIEVGMDIPNADIIVIEGAERFGLAQLHQLRGRVGRRENQESWCFLFSSKNAAPYALKRLKYFSSVNDGLKVAEFDLQNRGPGEVYGTKQAGIPDLKVASFRDIRLIKQTREAAEKMLGNERPCPRSR